MKFSTAKCPLAWAALLGLVCLASVPASAADGKGMAYVTNQNGDVTVIDLGTLEAVSEIDVDAEGPRGLGVTADGTLLVTANGEAGNLSVIDRATGKVINHIPIGKNPEFVRVRGDYAFVTFRPAPSSAPRPGSRGQSAGGRAREERERQVHDQPRRARSFARSPAIRDRHQVLRRRSDTWSPTRPTRASACTRSTAAGEEDLH